MDRIRTYSEMLQFSTFEDRFEYLMLNGSLGRATFGFDRWINQNFYRSDAWKHARRSVLLRDNGCDLAISDREIAERPVIHHVNPMSLADIEHGEEWIIDPNYLITTSHNTHNAIHYGRNVLRDLHIPREAGDTTLW